MGRINGARRGIVVEVELVVLRLANYEYLIMPSCRLVVEGAMQP